MKNFKIFLVGILPLFIALAISFNLSNHNVSAATITTPNDIPSEYKDAINNYDNNSNGTSGCYKGPPGPFQEMLMVYMTTTADPSTLLTKISLTPGQAIDLQVNYGTFICKTISNQAGQFYNAPLPRDGSSGGGLAYSEWHIVSVSRTLPPGCSGGSISYGPSTIRLNPPGDPNNQRYWFGSYNFQFTPPSGSGCAGTGRITFSAQVLNHFSDGIAECGANQAIVTSVTQCPTTDTGFDFNLVKPPKITYSCSTQSYKVSYHDPYNKTYYSYSIDDPSNTNYTTGSMKSSSTSFNISMGSYDQLAGHKITGILIFHYDSRGNAIYNEPLSIPDYPACYVPRCGILPTQSFTLGSQMNITATINFSPTAVSNPASPGSTPSNIGGDTINPFYIKQEAVRVNNSGIVGTPILGAAKYTQTDLFNSANLKPGNFDVYWGFPGLVVQCFAPDQDSLNSKPFFSVLGGDVIVGSKIGALPGSCRDTSPDPDGILAWNTNSPSSSFKGSGTTMAAQALGQIIGFVSNQNNTTSGNDLTFANIGTGIVGDIYGGLFGAAPCGPDLSGYDSLSTINTPFSNPSKPGTTAYAAGISIPGINSFSSQSTIYVNGNIYISNNITYNTNGWTSIDKIPNLKIIATGNIYIDKTVSKLDGTYIAKGVIKDCADSSGAFQGPSCYGTSTTPNTLTVNGSFMANQIYLERTGGNIYPTSSMPNPTPAEIFNYTPENWLAPVDGKLGGLTALFSLSPTL